MVGKICTVCRRCSYIDKHLSFFTYPGDPERRHEWLEAVGRMDLMHKVDNFRTRGNYRICEAHFEKKYVRSAKSFDGRKFLTKDAFPTLCLVSCSLVVPMTSQNFRKQPTSAMFAEKINYRNFNMDQGSISLKQKNVQVKPERRSARQREMALRNSLCNEGTNIKESYYESDDSSPPSSPIYEDISQFCESVMKVSKSTQTFAASRNKKEVDNYILQDKIKTRTGATDCDTQSFIQECSTFLPPRLAKLIKWTLSSSNGRQNINLILFAIHLYYSSNLYNILKDLLSLPSKETIKYFLLPKSTRLSENFINAFRCKVNNMSTKERLCSFSVGSILLKPNLYYDIKHDRIIGFHDVNGEQNICIAKYAILLMVQGILEDWRQPIAYAFISDYHDFPEISTWIDKILVTLIDIGLDIRVFVSDPKSEFLYASESRFVTTDKPFFTVNGTDIFYTYDTAQLLNIVNNNLKSCNFDYGLNTTVSDNNDFIKKINDLCNVLNAGTRFAKSPYKRAFANEEYQRDVLNEMLQLFQNLKVVRKADGADVTENMKFVEGFQITIKSIMQLFEELSFLGVKLLPTCRLNHSSLNRFFAKLKQLKSKEECTPRQFKRSFVRSFVFNMLKKPIGDTDNSLDSEEFSQQLLDEEFHESESFNNKPLSINTVDYRLGLPEKNAFVYVCGYCYLKCIQQHSCDIFKSYLSAFQARPQNSDQNADVYVCSVSLGLNVKNRAIVPPDAFTEYLMLLETKFKDQLASNVSISSIGHEIMQNLGDCEFRMPCPCFPIDYLKALFVRVRLFYTIRKNNRIISRKKGVKMMKIFNL